ETRPQTMVRRGYRGRCSFRARRASPIHRHRRAKPFAPRRNHSAISSRGSGGNLRERQRNRGSVMRSATLQRDTKETQIGGSLKIEGRGSYKISTGIRFFDHMLELFTK